MLTAIITTPIFFALVLLKVSCANRPLIARLSVTGSLVTLFFSLGLVAQFDSHESGMQFVEDIEWISMLNIHYLLGVDGITIWMIPLTTFLSVVAVFYALRQKEGVRFFMILLLSLEAGTLGVFLALDTILFYIFWELMLIPTYFATECTFSTKLRYSDHRIRPGSPRRNFNRNLFFSKRKQKLLLLFKGNKMHNIFLNTEFFQERIGYMAKQIYQWIANAIHIKLFHI